MARKRMMILVVDRNPNVREFLSRVFQDRGYHVRGASGRQGIEEAFASSMPPHLVVLDPELPVHGGESLVHELCAARPELPLVVHGHGVADLDAPCSGVVELVEKNGHMDALGLAVNRALRRAYPAAFAEEDGHVG
ncbi:MAG: response regulator [Desulfovibrionaceae bacterium]